MHALMWLAQMHAASDRNIVHTAISHTSKGSKKSQNTPNNNNIIKPSQYSQAYNGTNWLSVSESTRKVANGLLQFRVLLTYLRLVSQLTITFSSWPK